MVIKVCIILVLSLIFGVLSQNNKRKVFEFQQNDYNVEFERIELDHYDTKYVKFAQIVTFKYNRTCPVVNATFILNEDCGNHLQVIVQAYKFMSNEYRYFPLRFEVNICDAFSKNLVGIAESINCGNFTGCPIRKNVKYHICYWTLNQTYLPPQIPNGKYMIHLDGLLFGNEIGAIRGYGTVSRPIVKK